MKKYIYFDNAATSFPKPKQVIDSVVKYMSDIGANPSRSAHKLSISAGEIIFETRNEIAKLFNIQNPMRVILCSNATEALNLSIKGTCKKNDHIICSHIEHNSTIRPLKHLEKNNIITLSIAKSNSNGIIDINELEKQITKETKIIIINHASNVSGIVQDLEPIGKLCQKYNLIFIVDASQSAGIIPIDMKKNNISILAFTGHKSLYGPTGTGGMAINDNFDYKTITPLKFGGTGSLSDSIEQPNFLPDMFESGTLNTAGFSGLLEGIKFIKSYQIDKIKKHKEKLIKYFIEKSKNEIENFKCFTDINYPNTGNVSFILENNSSSIVAHKLSQDFNIMCRIGLHCSPLAHKLFGTYPSGSIRFSFGVFNTKSEIDIAIDALKNISENKDI